MPGFASVNPQNLPTLRVARVNGGSRSCATTNGGRSKEQMNSAVPRIDQRNCSLVSKDMNNTTYMDDMAAEESLSLYCKPVELYNIVQRRALRNPSFLQRCLSYKIQVSRQKRIKMTIRIPAILSASGKVLWSTNKAKRNTSHLRSELQDQKLCSVFVMLTTPISSMGMGCSMYRLSQTRILNVPMLNTSLCELGGNSVVAFLLPEVRKLLLTAKKDGDCVIFITSVDQKSVCNGKDGQVHSLGGFTGPILWGSLPVTTFCQSWLNHWSNGASITGVNNDRLDGKFQVELHPSMLQHEKCADGPCIKFLAEGNSSNGKNMLQLQLYISAEQVGRTFCSTRSNNKSQHASPTPPFSQAQGIQTGRVVFRYFYYFNQRCKTEVTEEFSCPFCLVGGASFKGLSYHLNSTHDLFRFEFLVTPDHQIVNVTCRSDLLGPEGNVQDADGLNDPRLKNFVYWSKSGRPRNFFNRTLAEREQLSWHETASLDVNLSGSQEPISLSRPDISALQQDPICKNSLESSTLLNDSQRLGNNIVHKVYGKPNYQLPATSSTSVPATDIAAGTSDLQLKRASCQDQSNIHERQDGREPVSKVVEGLLPPLQKRQSSEEVFDEPKTQMSNDLPSSGAGETCLVSAAPMLIDESTTHTSMQCPSQPTASQVENCNITIERSGVRNRALLQKRQFYHSRTAQPMPIEQLCSDRDSEDEVDDEVTDIEDRRMLDDFVDVTQEEKQLMCMWNSFVRKQRVIADGHCPWACEAFSKLHAAKFAENSALRRCLMLFLIKLWNHHLVDGSTINRCLSIADSWEKKI